MGKRWGVLSRGVIGSDLCLHTVCLDAMLGIKYVERQSNKTSAEAPGTLERRVGGLGHRGSVTSHIAHTF